MKCAKNIKRKISSELSKEQQTVISFQRFFKDRRVCPTFKKKDQKPLWETHDSTPLMASVH